MKLYRINIKGEYKAIKYILAINSNEAIVKYCEVTQKEITEEISCILLCERDDIIPTVEPIKEIQE